MKVIRPVLLFFILCCGVCVGYSQAGEWTWLRGIDTTSFGHFGIQGVPDTLSDPPSLYEACEWADLNGNFWLYGGLGQNGIYSDLWKYNPNTNMWTWMKGPGVPDSGGVYGRQGVFSVLNKPPALTYGVNSWVDLNGNFWMFGGGEPELEFNDLWEYDVRKNEWAWIKGQGPSAFGYQPGVYGIQGVPDTANIPPSRTETAASWTDNNGDLWLFGGGTFQGKNDLWRYNISTNTWTWMKGSNIPNQPSIYGTKGIEDSINTPGARWVYSKWKDLKGNFWLLGASFFGGNDLWRYNPTTNNWTWMDGDSIETDTTINGYGCVVDTGAEPNNALEGRATWVDNHGNFYGMIAGYQNYNSLWCYQPTANAWTIISSDSLHPEGIWGMRGISDPNNIPPYTIGSLGWFDKREVLYLFGGEPKYLSPSTGNYYLNNSLWKYIIDTTCIQIITSINNLNEVTVQIFPNPSTGSWQLSADESLIGNKFEVYNTEGQLVFQSEIRNSKSEINFVAAPGVYLLHVLSAEGNIIRKLVRL